MYQKKRIVSSRTPHDVSYPYNYLFHNYCDSFSSLIINDSFEPVLINYNYLDEKKDWLSISCTIILPGTSHWLADR